MTNFVKTKLQNGSSVVGIWSIVNSPLVSEILAESGLDFIILDMEHGAFDVADVTESIRATKGTNCSPLVRIPSVDPRLIQRVLDAGAHGLVAPQVRTKRDAEELVSSCCFPTEGIRGYNPYTRSGDFIGNDSSLYMEEGFPFVGLIIENLEAYKSLNEICEVPGIDMLYLGIYDMSCAFGIRGQLENELVTEFVKEATETIFARKLSVGKMVSVVPPENVDSRPFFYVLQPDTYQLSTAIQRRLKPFIGSKGESQK